MKKVLWVINYNSITEFVKAAVDMKVTDVAVRSDNDVQKAIDVFGAKGIGVYSWRWPSANRDPAMKEAAKIVGLLGKGLKGYYVDPEGAPGKPYDWDQKGLEKLADDFCKAVKSAATNGQQLGVTSHYRAHKVFPRLPWSNFFKHADVLLPQSYWRVQGGVVGHGIPKDNYDRGIEFWTAAGGKESTIVPMAGEIDKVTAAEIRQYAKAASDQGRSELHFYTYTGNVPGSVRQAIAGL